MRNRTLLIDSSYLLQNSYHGSRGLSTNKFGHIGGLYFFFTTLRKLIKKHKTNKVVLVWDGENGGVDRYLLDHAYKSNRKHKSWYKSIELNDYQIKKENEKDESILKQRKRIQAYAEELFLRQIEVPKIEADDLIAQYCIDNHEKEDIYLFTTDRDFAQLLDLNITILFNDLEAPINRTNFFFNFNYYYGNALTMKIICGDDADCIKGIKGVKETTLIKHFPDLQTRPVSVKEIGKKAIIINKERVENKKPELKAIKNIVEGIDRLKLNYLLINLRKPFLNEQAIEDLEQLEMPLSPEDRGSNNLHKMMLEDEFLIPYSSNFVNYVEPFYVVIMHEKQLLKEYNKKK